jgi:hypothetical protein
MHGTCLAKKPPEIYSLHRRITFMFEHSSLAANRRLLRTF